MRRVVLSVVGATLLSVMTAATALGAHCINESKKADAANNSTVLVNPLTGAVTILDGNAVDRADGGFADVYVDADLSGTLTAGDVLIAEDTFLISNHSHRPNPGQGVPGVLPSLDEEPGGDGHGIG